MLLHCFYRICAAYSPFPGRQIQKKKKKGRKDYGITLQQTLIVKFYSGITCLCFPWYLQGSNDCIALKETITNNGCISGMGEKLNFIITAFKGISISTDCCLFLKKKNNLLSRFSGCGNHTPWFPTPQSFFVLQKQCMHFPAHLLALSPCNLKHSEG